MQIVHAVVDHEGGLARIEVARRGFEDVPHRGATPFRVLRSAPAKRAAAPGLDGNAEMLLVPVAQLLGVCRLDEDAPDARDSFHFANPLTTMSSERLKRAGSS